MLVRVWSFALKLDVTTDLSDRETEHRTQVVMFPVASRVHAGDAVRLEELDEGSLSFGLFGGVKDRIDLAAIGLDQRETRNVREAVSDIDHVGERNAPVVRLHVLVHQQSVGARLGERDALVDLEQVASLLGEGDAAFDACNLTIGLLTELAGVYAGTLVRENLAPEDDLPEPTGDHLELD
jgi:hypothetical protein